MQKFLFYAFSGLLLLIAFGCKTKQVLADGEKIRPRSARFLQKQMQANLVRADWLEIKSRVSFQDANQTRKFTSNIVWHRDSIIWMNFKKASIEAARVLITPDSIFAIDRLNKQYLAEGFDYAQRQFQLPATFAGLESILLGNPFFFTTDLAADIADGAFRLQGETERFKTSYYLQPDDFLLQKIILEVPKKRQRASIELENYTPLSDGQKFSYFRKLNLNSPETGEAILQFDFIKVTINEPSQPRFEIPEHYTRTRPDF